jgi:hypothetical protein
MSNEYAAAQAAQNPGPSYYAYSPAAAAPAPAEWAYPEPAWSPTVVAAAPPVASVARAAQAADRPAADFLFILLLIQASTWLLAAILDLIFGLAVLSVGNVFTAVVTFGVVAFAIVLAVGIARGKRWVRRPAIILEAVFLSGWLLGVLINLTLIRVPTGQLFSDGPVTLLTDVAIPLTVIVLMVRKPPKAVQAVREAR